MIPTYNLISTSLSLGFQGGFIGQASDGPFALAGCSMISDPDILSTKYKTVVCFGYPIGICEIHVDSQFVLIQI